MGNEYYGAPTTPTSDYLAHYGIKGMKWGVRKAVESGNARALGRQYRKAQKKLAKLERQAASGKKYAKRAALMGAGAAAAGGIAATGTKGVAAVTRGAGRAVGTATTYAGLGAMKAGQLMRKAGIRGGGRMGEAGRAMYGAGNRVTMATSKAGKAIEKWGHGSHDIATAGHNIGGVIAGKQGQDIGKKIGNKLGGSVTNNTLVRLGSAGVGAGMLGGAAYNAYRAATTKKAAKKAAQFRNEMDKAFAGTAYANGNPNKKRRRRG